MWRAQGRGICALIIAAHAATPSALDALQHYCPAPLVPDVDALVEATTQLTEYLDGTRQTFDLPLDLAGTPFQRQVWDALLAIPYGETVTYRDLAYGLGQPGGAQAVGGAVARNPISIIVPCHRVLGSNGSLTGYAWASTSSAGCSTMNATSPAAPFSKDRSRSNHEGTKSTKERGGDKAKFLSFSFSLFVLFVPSWFDSFSPVSFPL